MNALDYFLKANLYGLLFVGCYGLLLRRHTFFGLNRAYLLLSVMLTLTLPLLSLPTETAETLPLPVGVIALPTTAIAAAPTPIEPSLDWMLIGQWAYGLVAVVLLIQLGRQIERLLRLIRQSTRHARDGYVLVESGDRTVQTFSFFGYLVANPADLRNELIIRHELVHIRQLHSFDVLVLALLKAVFWLCPALRLLERALRQVHEFLADRETNQPTDYARFLVDYAFGLQPVEAGQYSVANGFFTPSLLKQRIQMLQQKATTRWALGKYALVLPLALGLLAMTTAREEITTAFTQQADPTKTVTGRIISAVDGKPLPGAIVTDANTGKGIPTDANGRYHLKNVLSSHRLSVSFVGFETVIVPIDKQSVVNVALAPQEAPELPAMGSTAVYKAIKPNPNMPVRTPPSSETINGRVYTAVEEPPVFPTGIPGIMQYVAHNLRYPASAKKAGVEGTVFVQFVVLPTGKIGPVHVKKGIGSGCDEEATRVVKQMPKWIPGQQNGKPVSAQYVLPVLFSLEESAPAAKPDSTKKQGFNSILDNTKNAKYTLYGDTKTKSYPTVDSIWKRPSPVSIRGVGPLGPLGEEPLYILDGTEVSDKLVKSLNGKNIQSIDVLKGESATSVYGEKGKYGVVIITTKKS
ncbi:M56 family metallopeptidase [Spirosoma fluminis]